MQVQFFTDGNGVENSFCLPIAGGPVKSQSALDYLVEASADLFERSVIIVNMRIENIHIIQLQPF
jgi:hypothetical protein